MVPSDNNLYVPGFSLKSQFCCQHALTTQLNIWAIQVLTFPLCSFFFFGLEMVVPEVDQNLLTELEAMGFPKARATRALHYSGKALLSQFVSVHIFICRLYYSRDILLCVIRSFKSCHINKFLPLLVQFIPLNLI